jgi:hypothetical protein
MLKKSLFSPAQPLRAETRFPRSSFSHRSDPQRTERHTPQALRHHRLTNSAARTNVVLLIRRTVRLATALLDGIFEQPSGSGWSVRDPCQSLQFPGLAVASQYPAHLV